MHAGIPLGRASTKDAADSGRGRQPGQRGVAGADAPFDGERHAHDGLAALDAAAAFEPDVVLRDIGLLKLNGHEVRRRIREQANGAAIMLVALTG